MKVKAQGLLNAAKWIKAEAGSGALEEVLGRCDPRVRDRIDTALALEWHPAEELIEFVTAAEAVLGARDGQMAQQMGAAAARCNLNGIVKRTIFYFANRQYMMRRLASMWRQFNDEGELTVITMTDRSANLELSGISSPNYHFCCLLTGWAYEVSRALGIKNPRATHHACRARGNSRCLWDVVWTQFDIDESEIEKRKSIWG